MPTRAEVDQAHKMASAAAAALRPLPPGVTEAALIAAGIQAVNEAVGGCDPAAGRFHEVAAAAARGAMLALIRKARAAMPPPGQLPAPRPAPAAEYLPRQTARCRPPVVTVAQVEAMAPEAAEIARRVTAQQLALTEALSPEAVGDVVGAVLKKARGGDLAAAKMVFDLVRPAASGPTVQVAVVNPPPAGDDDED